MKNIGFDVDGTICHHPAYYSTIANALMLNGSNVHIVTARPYSEQERTLQQLRDWGFVFPQTYHMLDVKVGSLSQLSHHYVDLAAPSGMREFYLHMWPTYYGFPFTSDDEAAMWKNLHADWKVAVCKHFDIGVMHDDCTMNVERLKAGGIYTLQVFRDVRGS